MTQRIEIDEERRATPNFKMYLSSQSLIFLKFSPLRGKAELKRSPQPFFIPSAQPLIQVLIGFRAALLGARAGGRQALSPWVPVPTGSAGSPPRQVVGAEQHWGQSAAQTSALGEPALCPAHSLHKDPQGLWASSRGPGPLPGPAQQPWTHSQSWGPDPLLVPWLCWATRCLLPLDQP